MIEFSNISKTYILGDQKWTFGPASLSVPADESVCIVGPSGSGKSTLLHLLGSLDSATHGEISVGNKNISKLNDNEKNKYRKENIGFVFQDFHLFPELTVFENIRISLDLQQKLSEKEISEKIKTVLLQTGLENKSKNFPHQLSGGQQQRVAIARAIIHSPKLLLADEPTGNLDAHTGKSIIELLFSLKKENNMGLWCVTHDRDLAKKFSTILHVDDGKIVKIENK